MTPRRGGAGRGAATPPPTGARTAVDGVTGQWSDGRAGRVRIARSGARAVVVEGEP
ncbi:hypothetical protein QNO09_07260 [Streptomyces sp. 378]|nr:hypothetical protein [Streptomyces sp. 378]